MGNLCHNSKVEATLINLVEENKGYRKREKEQRQSVDQVKILYEKLITEKESSLFLMTNQLNLIKNENISLAQRNEKLKNKLLEGCQDKGAIDFFVNEYEEKLKNIENDYKQKSEELVIQNEKLIEQMIQQSNSKRKKTLWAALKYIKRFCQQDMSEALERWKVLIDDNESTLNKTIDLDTSNIYDDNDVKVNQENITLALGIICEEKKAAIHDNPLVIYYDNHKGRGEKAMSYANVIKFFEDMLDKKYEADCADLEAKRAPRTFPDYMMDHLIRVYGLKKIAQKSLCQIIPTLEELNRRRHAYGTLISRLVQVIHHDPIPYQLALFLTKARVEFNKLVLNTEKDIKARGQGIAKSENKDKEGMAYLVDLMNLIYNLFENDKYSRAKAISLLKPDSMSTEQFMIFRICHKIIRMGETAEIIFGVIDMDRNNNEINRDQLVEGIRKYLELAMPEDELKILYNVLDPQNTNKISKYTFLNKINLKNYYETSKSHALTIKKSRFLLSLIEVYKTVQIKDTAVLASWFKSTEKTHLDFENFKEYIQTLDPLLSYEEIQSFYNDGLMLNHDASLEGLTSDAFCKVVIRESIGGRGARDFSKFYVELKPKNSLVMRKNSDLNINQDEIRPSTPTARHKRRASHLATQPPIRSKTPELTDPSPAKFKKRSSFIGLIPTESNIPILKKEEEKVPEAPGSPRFGWKRLKEIDKLS